MKNFREILNESSLPSGFDAFGFDSNDSNNSKSKKDEPVNKLNATRDSIIKIKNHKFKVFRVNGDYSFSVIKLGTKGKKYYELVSDGKDEYEVWELTGGGMKRKNEKSLVTGKGKVVK